MVTMGIEPIKVPHYYLLLLDHSGGDSVVLDIAPASPTSWDLGPRLHIRFGVGGTLNSMKQHKRRFLCERPELILSALW